MTKINKKLLSTTRQKILSILTKDGRKNLTDIAHELGISHVAVKRHIDKLIESGILRIQGNINPDLLSLRLILVFMEIIDEEHMRDIINKFKGCPRMVLLARIMGGYNLIAILYAENDKVLECFCSICSIRTMPGIRRTEVYILSKLIKPEYLPIYYPLLKKSQNTPCGRSCRECIAYVENKCLGCPSTIYYKLYKS